MRSGKTDEAEEVFRTELEQFRKNYGHDHPDVCESLVNFSTILIANGKHEEAETLCEESLPGRKVLQDPPAPKAPRYHKESPVLRDPKVK